MDMEFKNMNQSGNFEGPTDDFRKPVNSVLNYDGSLPEAYKPISMWGYLGYEILFSIPCIGFILLIYFSIAAKNVNVKNFARSYFCLFIIAAVIFVIALVVFGGAAAYYYGIDGFNGIDI